MSKYLIEVSLAETVAAKRIFQSIRVFGSHFANRADWARAEGILSGTLVVDADDRRSVFNIVPPNMRSSARIFELHLMARSASMEVSDKGPHSLAMAA